MKKIFFCFFSAILLFSQEILIQNFECDLYSKAGNNALKKLSSTFEFQGRDLQINRSKLLDSLNIIISSYFLEDLLTSKGKENFKKMFIEYARKRHNIDIEEIFIIEMKEIYKPNVDEIIKALREMGICDEKSAKNTPKHNKIEIPKNTKIDLNGYDYTKDPNFGKDFGQ